MFSKISKHLEEGLANVHIYHMMTYIAFNINIYIIQIAKSVYTEPPVLIMILHLSCNNMIKS